jgi:hypothetical protein
MTKIAANPEDVSSYKIELAGLSSRMHLHLLSAKHGSGGLQQNLQTLLQASMLKTAQDAFTVAASQVGSPFAVSKRLEMLQTVKDQANVAAKQIADVTSTTLSAAMSKHRVASKARSLSASGYQLRNAFFIGTTRGWELNKKSKKLWVLSDAHDRDDACDLNAEEGPISVFDAFESGDYYPPMHQQCGCTLALLLN